MIDAPWNRPKTWRFELSTLFLESPAQLSVHQVVSMPSSMTSCQMNLSMKMWINWWRQTCTPTKSTGLKCLKLLMLHHEYHEFDVVWLWCIHDSSLPIQKNKWNTSKGLRHEDIRLPESRFHPANVKLSKLIVVIWCQVINWSQSLGK